jgi:hypothetical protein
MLGKNNQTVTTAQPMTTAKNKTILVAVCVSLRSRKGGL